MAAGEKLENNESMTNNNISLNKMTPSTTSSNPGASVIRTSVMNGDGEGAGMMEEVVEQVVEEGAIVLEPGNVVMVAEGEMGGQQIVIKT